MNHMSADLPKNTIETLYNEAKHVIEDSRNHAYRAANFAMVQAYWSIGKLILEEEQNGEERAEYGKGLIKELSKRLSAEYGKGFDASNLRYIRQFYRVFQKRDALRHELSWTHYRLLLKVEDEKARAFYLNEAVESNWSTRSLERQINNLYYQRMVMSRNDKGVKKEAILKTREQKASDIKKDRSGEKSVECSGLQPLQATLAKDR